MPCQQVRLSSINIGSTVFRHLKIITAKRKDGSHPSNMLWTQVTGAIRASYLINRKIKEAITNYWYKSEPEPSFVRWGDLGVEFSQQLTVDSYTWKLSWACLVVSVSQPLPILRLIITKWSFVPPGLSATEQTGKNRNIQWRLLSWAK